MRDPVAAGLRSATTSAGEAVTGATDPAAATQLGIRDSATRPLRIALIAGEASGDLLAADLVRGLRRRYPDAELVGVCGPAMRAAGVTAWADCSELAVMGLAEVLRHLPRLLRLRRELRARLLAWQPDVLIGIDAPDFNLGLERSLKQAGIATVHYVSPSVWAWREKRAAKIKHCADRVLCLFPMEPPIYARYGLKADFVGHPMASQFVMEPDSGQARRQLGIDHPGPLLGLLPGSRLGEIRRLAGDFLAGAALFLREQRDFRVLAPMANGECRVAFQQQLERLAAATSAAEQHPNADDIAYLRQRLDIVDGQSHAVMQAADLLLLASGTAALEGLLAKRPMVVGYRIAPLTHWIVKRLGLLRVEHYSLPNILAGGELVPELMQHDCTPSAISAALSAWWRDPQARAALLPRYRAIHHSLLQPREHAAATAVAELLQQAPMRC